MVKVGISEGTFFRGGLHTVSNKYSAVIQMRACVCVYRPCVSVCEDMGMFVSCSAEQKHRRANALAATSHWNSHHTPACLQLAAGGAEGEADKRREEERQGWRAGGGGSDGSGRCQLMPEETDSSVPPHRHTLKNLAVFHNNDDFCGLCLQKKKGEEEEENVKLENHRFCKLRPISWWFHASLLIISLSLMMFLWCFLCCFLMVITMGWGGTQLGSCFHSFSHQFC